MKNFKYHPIAKALAWVALFAVLCVTVVSILLNGYFFVGNVEKLGDGVYTSDETRWTLQEKLFYVEEYLTLAQSHPEAFGDHLWDMLQKEHTNFRFSVLPPQDASLIGVMTNDAGWDEEGAEEQMISIGYHLVGVRYGVAQDTGLEDEIAISMRIDKLAYELRVESLICSLVGICFAVLLTVYLVKVAGRRYPDGKVTRSRVHSIPYELVAIVTAGVLVLLVYIVLDVLEFDDVADLYRIVNEPLYIGLFAGMAAGAFAVCAFALHTLVVRIRRGKWYKTFLVYYVLYYACRVLSKLGHATKNVLCAFGRMCKYYFANLPLYAKFGGCYLVLSVVEFLVLILAQPNEPAIWVLWVPYKIVITLLLLWHVISLRQAERYGEQLAAGEYGHPIDTKWLAGSVKPHAENLKTVQEGLEVAVRERVKSERMKTELITNVSHDIKTPLTSIINYVELLKKEPLQPEVARDYVEVLDRQSARLKKLTEDVVEASKAASGAIQVQPEPLDLAVFLSQVIGEYEERMAAADLTLVSRLDKQLPQVYVDARHLWRVLNNLLGNALKYAQSGTRVYLSAYSEKDTEVRISVRNISAVELGVDAEELTERFVRGDDSRNTEGSGLGLSIAKSLVELMHGDLSIELDEDLFKVIVTLPVV